MTKHSLMVASAIFLAGIDSASSAQSSTETYTYDALGRLIVTDTSGGENDAEVHSLCYDKAGNRTEYKTTSDGAASSCIDDGSSGGSGGGGGGTPPPPPPPPSNNPPVTQNDSATLFCDMILTVNLTANDSDPEGNFPLTVTNVVYTSGSPASVSSFSASSATIDAGPIDGITTFTYTVQDSLGASSTGTLTIATTGCGGGFPF